MQTNITADNDFVILRRYLMIVVRRWWLLVLAVGLAVTAAYFVTKRQTPVYQATTSLIVGQTIQSVDLTARDIQISGQVALVYADMARRQPVLQATVDTLGLNMTWRELKSQVRVSVNKDIHLLEITAEASSPAGAQAIANEIARRLILLGPSALESQAPDANERFVQERLNTLRTRIQEGQAKLKDLEVAVLRAQSVAEARALQDEIHILENLISTWESNYAQLLALADPEKAANYLAVIEPAQAFPYPVRPNLHLNAFIAALLGIAFAVGLILLLEYFDDTLKTSEDVSNELGMTPLGAVGHIRGRNYQDKLVTRQDPFSQIAESYRIIRSNIQFVCVDGSCRTLLITSAVPGEGKSTLVANLAIAMAQAGYRTIVVDADLRRPAQHRIFQLSNRRGLTDLLLSPEPDIEINLNDTPIAALRVLTSGDLPPNPSELLSSQRMAQVIGNLERMADIVVFDSPPAVSVADSAVLSNRVNGVVLLVEAGQTHRTVVKQALLNLERAGANILGVVLNRVSPRDGHYPSWRIRQASALGRDAIAQWLRSWTARSFSE